MKEPRVVPAMLRRENRVRYLKLIAVFKIGNGLLFALFGFSILFLNGRHSWMDQVSDWIDAEILLGHSRIITFLLNTLQDVIAGGQLRATAFLMLFYAAVLVTEGIGVYLQQRWAELLMIFATGALIPLEAHHLWVKPSLAISVVLAVNCFIVWFLYMVLRRKPNHAPAPVEREVAPVG